MEKEKKKASKSVQVLGSIASGEMPESNSAKATESNKSGQQKQKGADKPSSADPTENSLAEPTMPCVPVVNKPVIPGGKDALFAAIKNSGKSRTDEPQQDALSDKPVESNPTEDKLGSLWVRSKGGRLTRAEASEGKTPQEGETDPRRAMLGAITARKSTQLTSNTTDNDAKRSSLSTAINNKGHKEDGPIINSRAGMLEAIRAKDNSENVFAEIVQAPSFDDDDISSVVAQTGGTNLSAAKEISSEKTDTRSAMLAAINKKQKSDRGCEENDPSSSLLGAIKSRGKTVDEIPNKTVKTTANPRNALLNAVGAKDCTEANSTKKSETSDAHDSRNAMLAAILSKKVAAEAIPNKAAKNNCEDQDHRSSMISAVKAELSSKSELIGAGLSSTMLSAIQARKDDYESHDDVTEKDQDKTENDQITDRRSSLLNAIEIGAEKKKSDKRKQSAETQDPKNSMLNAIRGRTERVCDDTESSVSTLKSKSAPVEPRSAMLAAIQGRNAQAKGDEDQRSSLLNAISSRGHEKQSIPESGSAATPSDNPRNALLDAIKSKALAQNNPARSSAVSTTSKLDTPDPRSALLDGIRVRREADESSSVQDESTSEPVGNEDPRSSLLDAIKSRGKAKISKPRQKDDSNQDPRSAMLNAIRRSAASEEDDSTNTISSATPSSIDPDPRSAMLAAIQRRKAVQESSEALPQEDQQTNGNDDNMDPRSSLLNAIKSGARAKKMKNPITDTRNSMLDAICGRTGGEVDDSESSTSTLKSKSTPVDPRSAMLAAIQDRRGSAKDDEDPRSSLLEAITNRGEKQYSRITDNTGRSSSLNRLTTYQSKSNYSDRDFKTTSLYEPRDYVSKTKPTDSRNFSHGDNIDPRQSPLLNLDTCTAMQHTTICEDEVSVDDSDAERKADDFSWSATDDFAWSATQTADLNTRNTMLASITSLRKSRETSSSYNGNPVLDTNSSTHDGESSPSQDSFSVGLQDANPRTPNSDETPPPALITPDDDPILSLMDSIKSRRKKSTGQALKDNMSDQDPRTAMLNAIKARQNLVEDDAKNEY